MEGGTFEDKIKAIEESLEKKEKIDVLEWEALMDTLRIEFHERKNLREMALGEYKRLKGIYRTYS